MTDDSPYMYAMTADPNKPLREAKELITRLAAERDCLLAERDEALSLFRTQQMTYVSDVQRLTVERDIVRKRLCFIEGVVRRMWSCQVAEQYGWDCFKEDGK